MKDPGFRVTEMLLDFSHTRNRREQGSLASAPASMDSRILLIEQHRNPAEDQMNALSHSVTA
jgi:hypothetical protein